MHSRQTSVVLEEVVEQPLSLSFSLSGNSFSHRALNRIGASADIFYKNSTNPRD